MNVLLADETDFQVSRLIRRDFEPVVAGSDLFDQDKTVAFTARARG